MPRILHLHQHEADYQTRCGLDLLTKGVYGDTFETRTIGHGGTYRSTFHVARKLRSEAGRFDVIHVWDLPSLQAVSFLSNPRIVWSPSTVPTARQTLWLRLIAGVDNIRVGCSSELHRQILIDQRFRADRCFVIAPGLDASRLHNSRPAGLRQSLGLNEDDRVIFAPGASTRAAEHEYAVWVASIVQIIDPRFKILTSGRGDRAGHVVKRAWAMGRPQMLVARPRASIEDLLAASDCALITGGENIAMLPVAECMAAGLPIVATTNTLTELLRDGHNALLAPFSKPPVMAKLILSLFDDPSLANRISSRAQSDAATRFSSESFLGTYRALYRHLYTGEAMRQSPPEALGNPALA